MFFDAPHLEEPKLDAAVQVYLLGQVDFEEILQLQRRLVYEVAGAPDQAALILCEHPPLITVGRQGSWRHILFDQRELMSREWQVRWVNRGGGCLLHLPGQLAVYPVLSLGHLGLGLREYRERLQQVFIDVLDDFRIPAVMHPERSGVRVGNRPIAAAGIAVRDWVAYYGGVLNVNPDLDLYRLVKSCYPEDGMMTSLVRERRGPLRFSLVRERLLEHFMARFPFARLALFSDHPMLRRKVASDVVVAGR
ncbi:MAG: lipoyl(octanoyl) transferase LipB [Gemmataceae bacterium]